MDLIKELTTLLADEFDIDPTTVRPEADLVEDLDIDSIDAIDMLARLREVTGKDLQADALKDVRTVADVLALVERA